MDNLIRALLAALVALLIGFGVGYYQGVEHQKNVDIIAQVKINKEAMDKYDKLSLELEDERRKNKVVYRTITKEVEKIIDRPIYSNQCFDDDGVRLYNDALKGTNSSKPSN